MGTPPPSPPSVVRKAYQTDSRALADILFVPAIMAALGLVLELLSRAEIPVIMIFAVASLFCVALYALLTNLLTIFRFSLPTVLASALIVFVLSLLMVEPKLDVDLTKLWPLMPLFTIVASQAVEAGFRRLRRG